MTSLSISAPFATTAAGSPSTNHARKHSRSRSAVPLPTFTFNPGVESSISDNIENESGVLTAAAAAAAATAAAQSGHLSRPSKPSPLPDFSFNPGAALSSQSTPSPTHPVLEEMALNQQRVSRSARPAPLPVFTFNPGLSPTPQSTSPIRSDFSTSDPVKPSSGHKRAGSEFVGGSSEAVQVVSTSPQKQEHAVNGPPFTLAGRRGHSHRRSQAISVSDIDTSDLIKAHAKSRAPSAPSTPHNQIFTMPQTSPGPRHAVPILPRSQPGSPRHLPAARPRVVDFSEKVDVIPRPLSMISSGTEGSSSTVRGHSVSNSINSIASSLQISPPRSVAMDDTFKSAPDIRPRPKTADSTTLLAAARVVADTDDQLTLPKRPLSASGSPADLRQDTDRPAKKKHFWSSSSRGSSPAASPEIERADPLVQPNPPSPRPTQEQKRPKTAPALSTSSKRAKYHTWTSGIFSKKSRRRGSRSKLRRVPTPPFVSRRDSDGVNEIFDSDDTVVIREGSPVAERKPYPTTVDAPPYPVHHEAAEDLLSPILDLDAALGPFGSDDRFAASNNRSAAARIAKLHSSERRGVVDAFGIVHRRTESAPNMPAVNRSFFGMVRHSSNGSLAEDVIDEEEEDNFLADQQKASSDTNLRRKDQGVVQTPLLLPESIASEGLGLSHLRQGDDAIVIVDADDEAQADELGSSQSTIEAPVLDEHSLPKRPSTSPMPFAYPTTQSHYASSTEGRTTTASLISSPDPDHVSFDASCRVKRIGEPSPDFRIRPSTDDIPSLSDSVSSGLFPRNSSSGIARPSLEQRSNSMFVPGSSRSNESWKRSSLASLNRLIPGSSHGSRLKFEATTDPASTEERSKKKNRLSKLKFWRSKDEFERP